MILFQNMKTPEQLTSYRHTLAHLLAAAILEYWPDTKNTIGPAVDNGFYYDFEFSTPLTDKDLKKVEQKMRELLKGWKSFTHEEVSAEAAREKFKDNPYKLELINEIVEKGEKITLYTSGDFTDLCRGGHVESPSKDIPSDSFMLDRIAGAYWRGDENNIMLTRVYGLAFESKEALDTYLTQREEAQKRDHKKLGKELGLFVFSELVGPGLPLYTSKGTAIRNEIVNFSRELQEEIGFEEVHTPNMNKAELFKISGHYEKYREDMFKVSSQYTEEEYFLKPMNCPQHTQLYAASPRSYRDLPIRIADFSTLYRDEKPGQLSGLTRLRAFSQDDGHIFCREDQIKDEFVAVLGAIKKALTIYGMEYKIRLSLWDPEKKEKYLGDQATWEKAQKLLEDILVGNNIQYEVGIGEAAIYGPKMDVITRDSIGREWQISTIQLDFIMPARFELEYTDHDGMKKTPVMIHRALIGSPERFMGILIEHYAGNFPLWLSPVQVKIIPIGEAHHDFAKQVTKRLKEEGVRVDLDDSKEGLGKKVRAAKVDRIPYWIVIGDKEVEAGKLSLESRDHGQLGQISVEEIISKFTQEIKGRK